MNIATNPKDAPNRLLMGLVAVSLGLHLLLIHLIDGWHEKPTTYIEFTLKDASPPATRVIPRPRIRDQAPALRHAPDPILRQPSILPIPFDPPDPPAPVHAEIGAIPELPSALDVAAISASDWAGVIDPQNTAGKGGGITRRDYFELVRFKIETRKKYPEVARIRHMEGRVTVGFALTAEGRVENVLVIKSSGRPILDEAAAAAVQDASPFPKPPPGLIQDRCQMTIVIAFELT